MNTPRQYESTVGDELCAKNGRWTFGGEVSRHFDQHVSKSVPLYEEGHNLILELSDFFLHKGSHCYDVGCSTGKLALGLAARHSDKGVRITAFDTEPDMVTQASALCSGNQDIDVLHADLVEASMNNSDMVICYYTLQFIHPKFRQDVISKIYRSLNWGGAFILFEKVRAPDARFQDITTQLYAEFKNQNGYSATEIFAKSRSLKGILDPFSTQANIDFLNRAGFSDVMTIMKYVCFEGMLAIK